MAEDKNDNPVKSDGDLPQDLVMNNRLNEGLPSEIKASEISRNEPIPEVSPRPDAPLEE